MKNFTTIDIYQVDAFSNRLFQGNPAAVCPLEAWYDDELLLKIACENNLSETAFFVHEKEGYRLRWFTPATEVELCGHATLATAWILFNKLNYHHDSITFYTLSGELTVTQKEDWLCMDFPSKQSQKIEAPIGLLAALGLKSAQINAICQSDDILIDVNDESLIETLSPDFNALININTRGVIVTSRSEKFDFISRWFGPRVGVNEDPVTGSAHTTLAPYWTPKIDRSMLHAEQGGTRKGQLKCRLSKNGQRVELYGQACLVMIGKLFIPL